MKAEYLEIGEIVRPQGVRGEVKVRPDTDDPNRFLSLKEAFFARRGEDGAEVFEAVGIESARVTGGMAFLKLDCANDRDEAEKLRGQLLYVDRAHAAPLSDDQAFIVDLIGMRAVDDAGAEIGTLRDVLKTGSADVFVFDTPRGEMMMPALKKVILSMDTDVGVMTLCARTLAEVSLYADG